MRFMSRSTAGGPVAQPLKRCAASDAITRIPPVGGAKARGVGGPRFEALFQPDSDLQEQAQHRGHRNCPQYLGCGSDYDLSTSHDIATGQGVIRCEPYTWPENPAKLAREEGQAKLTAWKAAPTVRRACPLRSRYHVTDCKTTACCCR